MRVPFIFLILSFWSNSAYSQQTDSSQAVGGLTGDTFYIMHENIPNSKLWGNSWYVSTAYNLSKFNEFDLNVGRTYGSSFCSGGGCHYTMRSWGFGYGYAFKRNEGISILKSFYEYSFFYVPPISWTLRAEYFYDFSNQLHYVRPSIGFNFIRFDILYYYSLPLNSAENILGHGLTLRYKHFINTSNWQKNYPNRS